MLGSRWDLWAMGRLLSLLLLLLPLVNQMMMMWVIEQEQVKNQVKKKNIFGFKNLVKTLNHF